MDDEYLEEELDDDEDIDDLMDEEEWDEDIDDIIEEENIEIDRIVRGRKGTRIEVGDRVKIVGSRRDCVSVHFAPEMGKYLNNDRIYRIRLIKKIGVSTYIIRLDGNHWSWCPKNIEKVKDYEVKEQPSQTLTFDPKNLDLG